MSNFGCKGKYAERYNASPFHPLSATGADRLYSGFQLQASVIRTQYPSPGLISVKSLRKGGAAVLYFFHGSAVSEA